MWRIPNIRYRDALAHEHAGEEEKYTLVLANPPVAGSLDYENTAKDLLQIVDEKTELLFLALFLRLLKPGGRSAVIVPDGVLFGSSTAYKTLRKILVQSEKLDAVVSLPGGVFKPYAGVSTATLIFTKTNSGGTEYVWFYDVNADGMSLDDKRTELLPQDRLGPVPKTALTPEEHAKNNLPDVLARWAERNGSERERPPSAQSFCVPKADIAAHRYDLSINRYKEVVHEKIAQRPPKEILAELAALEEEIQRGIKELPPAYSKKIYETKCAAVFEHVYASYQGRSKPVHRPVFDVHASAEAKPRHLNRYAEFRTLNLKRRRLWQNSRNLQAVQEHLLRIPLGSLPCSS